MEDDVALRRNMGGNQGRHTDPDIYDPVVFEVLGNPRGNLLPVQQVMREDCVCDHS